MTKKRPNRVTHIKYAKIYKIVSDQTDDVYYGSTTRTLEKRFNEHKLNYKNWNDPSKITHYITSFEILNHEDARMELIEELKYKDYKSVLNREAFYIKNNLCVNEQIPGERANRKWLAKKRNNIELSIKRLIHTIYLKSKNNNPTNIDVVYFIKWNYMLNELLNTT